MTNKIIICTFALSISTIMLAQYHKDKNVVETKPIVTEPVFSPERKVQQPKNVCVFNVDSEVGEDEMHEFMSQCLKYHKNWLPIDDGIANYSNVEEEI